MDDIVAGLEASTVAQYFVVSPFLVNPTRATFIAKNSEGMLPIHAALRMHETYTFSNRLSKKSLESILKAAAEKGADVTKEMLEATDAHGDNCLMIALSLEYPFFGIAMFLGYCNKYADLDKILHQRNSDGLTPLSILTASPHYFTQRRLSRLISYFPTQKSFDKALATRDKKQRTVLESCSEPTCFSFLNDPKCWEECCDFRSRFDDTHNDVWQIREVVGTAEVELIRAMFLSLKDDNIRRKALSICVDPLGFNMLQEACFIDAPSETLKFLLDSAVELGIIQELLESVTPELGDCLRLCCAMSSLKIETLRLILHYYRKYANLPKLLQKSDVKGLTCVVLAISAGKFTQKKLEELVAYFPSDRMFRKVLKQSDFVDCFKTDEAKSMWQMLNQPGYWKKCRKSALMHFNYHALEMRDILQRLVKRGKANQKLKKLLSCDQTERVKETFTMKDRKAFTMFHSLCCRTLSPKTLKIFLDAAARVGVIKEVLEAQNDVNGENCLMLASGWFTVESFRLLAEFYEKHTDIYDVFRQKNDRGYDSISLVALRGENSLEFVKICLAQLPSDEVCREVVDKRPLKLDLVLPVETKEFLEEATMRDDCCWQECRDEWLQMKDDDELQEEEEEEEEEAEEEEEEEEEEEAEEEETEEEEQVDDDEEEKEQDDADEEEEEETSPLKDILDVIASSLHRPTNDEHQVALEVFCDSVNVFKKVRVGSVAKTEEENEEEQCQ